MFLLSNPPPLQLRRSVFGPGFEHGPLSGGWEWGGSRVESHFRSPAPYLGHCLVYPDTHALLWGGGDWKAVRGVGK